MDGDFFVKLLMALGGLATGIGGWFLSRRGQQDTARQQLAANRLQERVNVVEELEGVIERLKEERDHLAEARQKEREHLEVERERQAQRCQAHLIRLIDNVATLQTIVSEEVDRASTLEVVRDAQDHMEIDHDRVWGPDETKY